MTEKAITRLKTVAHEILATAPGITGDEYKAFLHVAGQEGCCQRDIQRELGVAQSTASAVVSRLNGRGHGLISSEVDPASRRRTNLTLSPKGRELIAKLAILIGCFVVAHTMLIGDLAAPEPEIAASHSPAGYDTCTDPKTFSCDRV